MLEAKIAHQEKLELLFSKNQLLPRIRQEFMDTTQFDFPQYIRSIGLPVKFGIDLMVQMALHKRADLPTLLGTLRHHYDTSQECADAIHTAAAHDLVDWSPELQVFIVKFTITADVQEELDRFQFPLPMVVEPKEVTHNKMTGYLVNKGSIILRDNHHDDDVCLDHINRLNKMKFCINHTTAKMIKNSWRNLDHAKEGESKQDFQRRVKAFEKYDRTAKDVIDFLIQEGNEFHLTHRYDKRGRFYCQGYHVTYQGNPWNKAVIEFADKEMID